MAEQIVGSASARCVSLASGASARSCLGSGMEGSASDVPDAAGFKPFGQIGGDVTGTVVTQQQ